MIKQIRYLCNVVRLFSRPKQERQLVFYSEGRNYWGYLEPMILELLAGSDIPVCYVSSDAGDPGLLLSHPNLRPFLIDEGHFRNWLFRNIETDIFVMTMPDLHQYQVKRSKNPVHYVYVQHSLVSLHMVYRKGAFDHFDTIFCAGPHHMKEIRAIEREYNLKAKDVFAHGYGRHDALLECSRRHSARRVSDGSRGHVLVAPSWGREGMIESGIGETVVSHLLRCNFRVTLRPHPQTVRFSKPRVDTIRTQHETNPLFRLERDVMGQDSFLDSDLMVSDWSGAALEYMLALRKPVLYVDVPMKVNNREYRRIPLEPVEREIRKSGRSDVLELRDVDRIEEMVESLLNRTVTAAFEGDELVFNPGASGRFGAKRLLEILAAGNSTLRPD